MRRRRVDASTQGQLSSGDMSVMTWITHCLLDVQELGPSRASFYKVYSHGATSDEVEMIWSQIKMLNSLKVEVEMKRVEVVKCGHVGQRVSRARQLWLISNATCGSAGDALTLFMRKHILSFHSPGLGVIKYQLSPSLK